MKQKLYLCLMLLSAFLISNCGAAVNPVPSPIASVTVLIENSTPTETNTPAITPTSTLSPSGIEYHCINISDDMTQLGSLNGTLVLNGHLVPTGNGKLISNPSLLVDMSSDNEIALAADDLTHAFVVSPDSDYLAFDVSIGNDYSKRQINILDSKGNVLAEIEEKDFVSMEWLSDKILLVDSQLEQYKNSPLIFLSPFDHTQKIVQPFVNEFERIIPLDHEWIYRWGFYSAHKIIYNPTFTRAIYAASDSNGSKIVFRDLTSNQDISAFYTQAWGVSPKWSPDGTKMAIGVNVNSITGKDELVVLDQNGVQLFATKLSTRPGKYAYISSLSWSPDGSRIAFWYTTSEDSNHDLRLAVFDIKTQKTIDYCITNNAPAHLWHRNDTSPIWSPDGSFLLIETPNANNNPNVVIVDLVQEGANIIKTGYEPIGWMK
ncbi:MAG: hypothetical protein ABI904_17690 [Chloroflexota bacterium]